MPPLNITIESGYFAKTYFDSEFLIPILHTPLIPNRYYVILELVHQGGIVQKLMTTLKWGPKPVWNETLSIPASTDNIKLTIMKKRFLHKDKAILSLGGDPRNYSDRRHQLRPINWRTLQTFVFSIGP